MPRWKSGGYIFQLYWTDHDPLHLHIFHDGRTLDRWDIANKEFMDGTVGRHRGRVIAALEAVAIEMQKKLKTRGKKKGKPS